MTLSNETLRGDSRRSAMNKVARQVRRAPQDLDRPEVAGQTALTKLAQEADAMHALLVLRADALMAARKARRRKKS
jgi:hypothetical protein